MQSPPEIPVWLTDSFLQEIVRRAKNDPFATLCHRCKVRPGVQRGQNYSSVLYRTTVHYRGSGLRAREQVIDLMLKSESREVLLQDQTMFHTEMRMYGEVLPAMERALEGAGETISVPRLIYSAEKPLRMIVMEDLSPAGWAIADQVDTYEEAVPAIRALAKFHAASLVLNQGSFQAMTLSNFANRTSDSLLSMFRPMFSSYIDTICSWDDFKEIRPRLQEFKASFADQYKQVYTANPGPEGYNVLNHGDFHGKNLLHLLDDQRRVVKTAALDYQVCSWGSPAIDLIYFLYLVVHRDVLDNHRDQLLEGYHRHFVDCLTRLNFQGWVPTHEDLQAELNRNVFFELFNDAVGAPFRTVDFGAVSLEDFLAGRVPNVGLSNAGYRRNVRANLTRLVARVAFNVAK
ncbi:Juvenile hormone-inducible protein [Culex quinquefasciatus]|uniref:Juvenile hormone-inducible protein n=1 Tax=Culex quinquefasciatus TaxID=7176 RepID=B0X7F2_CULQU|nr:Juvenile hormone-inducible protein [Culex quinquefasciatus]|eukprot:XP_001865573.1 Juvenile hormone-inducible protein [Culex quinquefasciatus]